MTKMKSKKMTKSTFAIIIMAIAMVAMLAFGGTYAYFTATANELTGSANTGTIRLSAGETATVSKENILPYEAFTVSAEYTDLSNRGNYIFFTITQPTVEGVTINVTDVEGAEQLMTTDVEPAKVNNVYFIKVEDATAAAADYHTEGTQEAPAKNVYDLVISAYFTAEDEWIQSKNSQATTQSESNLMGVALDFVINANSIQYIAAGTGAAGDAFATPYAAYQALQAQLAD